MDYLLVSRDGLETELMFPGYVGYQNCDFHEFAGDIQRYRPLGFVIRSIFSRDPSSWASTLIIACILPMHNPIASSLAHG